MAATTTSADTTSSSDCSISCSSSVLGVADEVLSYDIHNYSSFSTNYVPENVLINSPGDQSSRWSVLTNNPPQFLLLKLKRPAIVRRLKFGKFEKSHVCNLKKFRIYGGMEANHLVLLLQGGLKNDSTPEVFKLRCLTDTGEEYLPILYLKVVPILSWGPTFNFSIWYIELQGQDDPMFINGSMKNYNALREVKIIKLCLKHFRQQGYDAAFKALQEQTQVLLEHAMLTDLHKYLVVRGEFDKTEQFLSDCIDDGLMDDYLNQQDYKHTWRLQQTQSIVEPGNRGGHQLVMDTNQRLMYLYGGWNGFEDLSDLWAFDIEKNTWTLLFANSEECNGPTPRSCHKMVFDPHSGNIFMLGRYLDNSIRTTEYIKSDFFLYDTRARTWLQICDDTSHVGGPALIYDHQMCLDTERRTIYVFGGKVLTPRSVTSTVSNEPEYSGLFSYHIATNTWTQILVDCHHPSAANPDVLSIKSRITHCMVFHNKTRKLYVYGGQRGKEDIDDFFTYDVDTQTVVVLNKEPKNEPSSGYTLRASIDCERDEIYVFSSLSKLKDRRDLLHYDASNSFWVYSMKFHKWSRIYTCHHNPDGTYNTSKSSVLEPCPRYAHQMIYDDLTKLHHLFGGNPGKTSHPQQRLDDFWILSLEKPKRSEILARCRFLVRELHYEEMARSDPIRAVEYLRKDIAEAIDHTDAEQLKSFHRLTALLFKPDNCFNFDSRPLITPQLCKRQISEKFKATTADDSNESTAASGVDDDLLPKLTDSDGLPGPEEEDLSIDSYESANSATTSGVSDATSSYTQYRRAGGQRERDDFVNELRARRTFLFNQLAQLMPEKMVQPKANLSDFVIL